MKVDVEIMAAALVILGISTIQSPVTIIGTITVGAMGTILFVSGLALLAYNDLKGFPGTAAQ